MPRSAWSVLVPTIIEGLPSQGEICRFVVLESCWWDPHRRSPLLLLSSVLAAGRGREKREKRAKETRCRCMQA